MQTATITCNKSRAERTAPSLCARIGTAPQAAMSVSDPRSVSLGESVQRTVSSVHRQNGASDSGRRDSAQPSPELATTSSAARAQAATLI